MIVLTKVLFHSDSIQLSFLIMNLNFKIWFIPLYYILITNYFYVNMDACLCVCVHMCGAQYHDLCMEVKDHLWELVLTFSCVGKVELR